MQQEVCLVSRFFLVSLLRRFGKIIFSFLLHIFLT